MRSSQLRLFPRNRVPPAALEVLFEPGELVLALADLAESATSIIRAGMVQVVAPPASLPALLEIRDPLQKLLVPAVYLELAEVTDRFLGVVLGFKYTNASHEDSSNSGKAFTKSPSVTEELPS